MKNLVVSWLDAGASFAAGARLFLLLEGRKHPFGILLRRETEARQRALKIALSRRAQVKLPAQLRSSSPVAQKQPLEAAAPPVPKFREDWPFLQDPGCPPELKILVANKITAYHTFVGAHDRLFDCKSPGEQLKTVSCLIENYIENRRITRELKYYKEHKTVLGDHPVFKEFHQMKALRKMNVVELLKMKSKLEHNIWRIESEIRKGEKKHLAAERKQRLQGKKNLLAEVERLIEEYTA